MIRKMELDTAPTHMEWFFGDKGLKFSEIRSASSWSWTLGYLLCSKWYWSLSGVGCGYCSRKLSRYTFQELFGGHYQSSSNSRWTHSTLWRLWSYSGTIWRMDFQMSLPTSWKSHPTRRRRLHGQCLDSNKISGLWRSSGNLGGHWTDFESDCCIIHTPPL